MKIFENTQMSKNSTVCQYNTLNWKIKQYRIEVLQDALSKLSKTFEIFKSTQNTNTYAKILKGEINSLHGRCFIF